MKKYIVTGGAGLIGSVLVHEMNSRGIDSIIIVDHLGTSDNKWKNIRGLKFADYMEKNVFRNLIRDKASSFPEIEAIIHFGACSSTTETDASYLIDNNYEFSKEIANFAVSRDIKFIYASSSATYGDGSNGWDDNENQLEQLRPLNIYGYSKHIFDLWARRNGLLSKITGLKFTNVYGPNEWHKGEMRSLVCKAFDQIRQTGKIRLFKSCRNEYAHGEQKRDFIYVKDAVKMSLYLLENNLHGIFNIGSGRAETWNSLALSLFKAIGIPPVIEYVDMPKNLISSYQYYTCANISKLLNAGYKTNITETEKALDDYVKKYLNNEKHCGD